MAFEDPVEHCEDLGSVDLVEEALQHHAVTDCVSVQRPPPVRVLLVVVLGQWINLHCPLAHDRPKS